MKKLITFLLVLVTVACTTETPPKGTKTAEASDTGTYTNPIFKGDYPDPSILVDGEDYYMVHSSFEYYPGLLIWHSTDLINWEPVGNALHTYVGSVWAPDLVKHDGKYFIYFPVENTNYVVWADSINGPWSEPIDLKVGNIDPGHVADDQGNRYLYFSNGGYVPLAKDGLSVTGEFIPSYKGWEIPQEWSIECFCMEGPKLFKKGDYYYLTVAEGGTAGPATGHMVISARSKSPTGPWENSPNNPIIRTQSKEEHWWSVGHGTIFEDAQQNWWMVFHGYEKNHYNMGRQTMLLPINWTEDGWFTIAEGADLNHAVKLPVGATKQEAITLSDSFTKTGLNPMWKFFGNYDTSRFEATTNGLILNAKGNSIPESAPMLTIPADHSYSASVEMDITGNAMGGLVLYYSPKAYTGILADSNNILANLRGWQFVTEANVIQQHVFLKLENHNHTINYYYSTDGTEWHKIDNSAEVGAFHHNVLSGFLSLRIGLTAIGDGKVTFKNFTYTPLSTE